MPLPVAEVLVRGQDCRTLFVPVGDELEKEIGLPAVDRQIPDLINNDQALLQERFTFALGAPFGAILSHPATHKDVKKSFYIKREIIEASGQQSLSSHRKLAKCCRGQALLF